MISGNETEYQDLAFSGRPIWLEWNDIIASTPAEQLPRGLTPDTKLLVPCGYLRLANGPELSAYDHKCLDELEKVGLRHYQHRIVSRSDSARRLIGFLGFQKDQGDMERLREKEAVDPGANWETKVDVFEHFQGGRLDGFLDTSAGLTYSDKVRFVPI